MTNSLIGVVVSGSLFLFLSMLFAIERRRGKRFGDSVRSVFDRMFLGIAFAFRKRVSKINSVYFRELLHYVLHLVSSSALAILRRLEQGVLRFVHFNKRQAQRLHRVHPEGEGGSGHLGAIAEHKRAVELTPKQKKKRKEVALEGDHK